MPSAQLISGKIAAILTTRIVLINRGREHGVTASMRFQVLLEIPKIQDPENPGEFLPGPWFRKGVLRVTSTGDKVSLCLIEPGSGMRQVDETIGGLPPVQPPIVTPQDWIIRVGDTVKELPEEPRAVRARLASH